VNVVTTPKKSYILKSGFFSQIQQRSLLMMLKCF
jgi:hypothetical protein